MCRRYNFQLVCFYPGAEDTTPEILRFYHLSAAVREAENISRLFDKIELEHVVFSSRARLEIDFVEGFGLWKSGRRIY